MRIKISTKKWVLYFFFLLFTPFILMAQQDSISIHTKILESEETDQILIQRTRNFILNKLKSGNIDEALEAYNYIVQKYENKQVKAFWILEKYLLGYWFAKYDIIYQADSIENSIRYGSVLWNSQQEVLYPQPDKLSLELRPFTLSHRTELLKKLNSEVTNKEKHDYLYLFFDWITFNATKEKLSYKEEQAYLENNLTPRAEEFLSNYKDSRFRSFAQRHFRYVYSLSEWGYAYYLGMGSLSPQSTAGLYLKPEFTFGMGVNISWKSILLDGGFDIGIPVSIRKPFIYEGKTWNTDIRHNYYSYYISAGWVIAETKLFKLSPKIGIGGINMSVCEADKEKAGGDFSMTQAAIQYGINYDIKFSTFNSYYKENTYSYSGVRLGFDYYKFLGNNPVMSGGMLSFRISWVGFARAINRSL